MYPIRQMYRLQAEDIEYLGTKRKFWFTYEKERYLFKAEERGTGEDWAEKIVCELARGLGLPHVEYDLAHETEGGKPIQPGVICPRFVKRPQSFEMGNQLLVQRDPNYPTGEHAKYHVKDYTVEAVAGVMADLGGLRHHGWRVLPLASARQRRFSRAISCWMRGWPTKTGITKTGERSGTGTSSCWLRPMTTGHR